MDIFIIYKKKEGRDIGSEKMDEILEKEAMMVVLARGEERVQVRDKIINLWKRCHGLHGNLIKLVFRVRTPAMLGGKRQRRPRCSLRGLDRSFLWPPVV